MDFSLKTYKCFKFKSYLKEVKIFFFFHGVSLNNKNWIKIEQDFAFNQLYHLQVFNTLIIKILKNSIFKNVGSLIHGTNFLLHCFAIEPTRIVIEHINPLIYLLCLKLNNRVYSKVQLKNVQQLSYDKNMFMFYKLVSTYVTAPYFTLKIEEK